MLRISLQEAINKIPGKVAKAASVCDVSERAVYKWLKAGRLPRTEYTGETNYAERLSSASGGEFSPEQLLQSTKPQAA